jgi:membrane fusion protein, copper/silver efflux system
MTKTRAVLILSLVIAAGAVASYGYSHRSGGAPASLSVAPPAAAAERTILYYRDPAGAPFWSATPKNDAQGRAYVPVYDDAEPSFDLPAKAKATQGERKIRYYRNAMGLPDTSPVPKKDSMGMDYIPVYEGEDADDGTTVKLSLDKIQRSGVRTEAVEARTIVRPVRAVGTVKYDERRLTVVTVRADGYIEDLFVNATGQSVHAGDPLFRLYSKEIQMAQADLIVSAGVKGSTPQRFEYRSMQGTMQILRNLGVPESRIEEVRTTGTNPRTIDWPSPASGTVIDKRVINGQQVTAGAELYRIADLSHVWVIADVAESDLAAIKIGTHATVTVRAYAAQPVEGEVTFIYPELKVETRTARVRIELPNPDERLKVDMYADVIFHTGIGEKPAIAIPISALIDSGNRQIVLIAKGEGRFEPRPVKLGRHGDGYVEVLEGVNQGEKVVTSANFLIDAESNLKAALQAFTQPETPK